MPRQPAPTYTAHDARDLFTQLDWLVRVNAWLVLEALAAQQFQGRMLDMTDRFAQDLADNTAATNAATQAGIHEKEQFDAAVVQLNDVTGRLEAALAQLSTSQAPTETQLQALESSTLALRSIADRLTSDDSGDTSADGTGGTGTPAPSPTADNGGQTAPIGTDEAQAQASPPTIPPGDPNAQPNSSPPAQVEHIPSDT